LNSVKSDRAIMVGMQFKLRRVGGYTVLLLMAIATLASTVHAQERLESRLR
jgi:hypothetical protein